MNSRTTFTGSPLRITIEGFTPDFVDDLADRAANDFLDAQALLFLERCLDAAPLNEVLRFDDCQHLDVSVGLDRSPSRELKGDARFRAVVDHDQIGPFGLAFPHVTQLLR